MRCYFEEPVERDGQWIYRCRNCRLRLALPSYIQPDKIYRDCKPKPGRKVVKPPTSMPCVDYSKRIAEAIEKAAKDPSRLPRDALGVMQCITICEHCPENAWNPATLCSILACDKVTRTMWQYGHCPKEHW